MEVRNLKRKLRKKSALNNSIVKAIPLSVALSLFAAGTAFGSEFAGSDWLAVEYEDEVQKFNIEWLDENPQYHQQVHGALRDAWVNGDNIYVSSTEDGLFVDFSANASMEMTLEEILEVSEAQDDVLPGETLDVWEEEDTIY